MIITPEERSVGALAPESLHFALRTFRDKGYVVLENAYDLDYMEQLRTAYDAALEEYLESRGGLEAMEGKTFGKNHVGFFPKIVPPLGDNLIVAHPIAVQVMRELLGKDLQCGFFNTNTAMPGSNLQPVHRDTQASLFGAEMSVPHPATSLVLNIPLCDFTEENGSTEVWPGTHLVPDDPSDPAGLEERAKEQPSVRPDLKLGSFVLRDLRMWHRGMPNRADYPRTMFALVYSRGFLRAGVLEIPRSTWEGWSEDARHIFRNNRITDEETASSKESSMSSQMMAS